MRKIVFIASMLALAVAVAPACATKKFVRTEVGSVNATVATLSEAVEQTQARVTQNETRIGEVGRKVDAAATSATDARGAADRAASAANAASIAADGAHGRIAAFEADARRLLLEVTLTEAEGNFEFGRSELPPAARLRISEIVSQLRVSPKASYIEIEGHTDSVGSTEFNEQLGLKRAEAAKQYLYEQYRVPLHKMNIVTHGENQPVAPNETPEGRAQNRRIVIRVLS